MHTRQLLLFTGASFILGSAAMAACGGSSSSGSSGTSSGGSTSTAMGGNGSGGDIFTGGNNPGCMTDADCEGGVCHNGQCCSSTTAICGDGCCDGAAEVCLFDACVVPGDDCVSQADCPPDHYCEPALGEQGQGGQGANCTQPIQAGKCVPLPPTCDDAPNDPNCVDNCEYFPAVGQLNASIQWQWGYDPAPAEFAAKADVWATPSVARVFDANCDGKVDLGDPPNVVFVSGDSQATCCQCNGTSPTACHTGVLRLLDGRSGNEIWSLDQAEPSSAGFAGMSVALGDVDQDQRIDIVALTGEGKLAVIADDGTVKHLSSVIAEGATSNSFGWGGGISLGDMDNDGWPEIAFGREVWTMQGGTLAHVFTGSGGTGGSVARRTTHMVDLDGDGDLELLAGRTAYHHDGTPLWDNAGNDGFTATGDFDGDNLPEIVVISGGNVRIIEGADGVLELGPVPVPGTGSGGPPTVANFDGAPGIEIGVATATLYSVLKPNYANNTIDVVWSQTNHDNSSSVTGSSVFDFEGDGKAEVVYNDECFVWVYDGSTGDVLFTANTQSFTATEATIVADVDGDGHAEIVMGANGANPTTWTCAHHTTGNDGYPIWSVPAAGAYRGITVFADQANSWVGTRTIWNQHAYSVSNICDPRDSACMPGSYYGQIPTQQQKNWTLPWLNNFRQNVQDGGLFDAPDVIVNLNAECATPVPLSVQVRNQGLAGLPAGVDVGLYRLGNPEQQVGTVTTQNALFPGQTEVIPFTVPSGMGGVNDIYQARILIDPNNITFNECKDDNNESAPVSPQCVQ
jgi:FG-GAP-like repeat